jgi:hypothetical protein
LPWASLAGGRGRQLILTRGARRLLEKRVDPMMTPQAYEESLRELNLVVYVFGERIKNVVERPIILPSMKSVAKT